MGRVCAAGAFILGLIVTSAGCGARTLAPLHIEGLAESGTENIPALPGGTDLVPPCARSPRSWCLFFVGGENSNRVASPFKFERHGAFPR